MKARIAERIIANNSLKNVPEFNFDTKESRIILGEIGNSDEDALSLDNMLIINRDEDMSGAETKAVSLAEGLQGISLFEGEIVGLEGILEQKRFIADKVIKPKPIGKAPRHTFDDVIFLFLNTNSFSLSSSISIK